MTETYGFEPYIGTLQTISIKVRIQTQKSPLLLAGSFDKYGGEIRFEPYIDCATNPLPIFQNRKSKKPAKK